MTGSAMFSVVFIWKTISCRETRAAVKAGSEHKWDVSESADTNPHPAVRCGPLCYACAAQQR